MVLAAIITADIVNSTQIGKSAEKKLITTLSGILKPNKFEFYRGDSFQVYLPNPKDALKLVLLTRAAAKKLMPDSLLPLADIRASIGIGSINTVVKNLTTASGEAFILSGRAFDEMNKSEERLVMQSSNDTVNLGLKVTANYIDSLFSQLTARQAAVLFELLMGYTQTEAAKRLKKTQATINKHSKSARWSEINRLLQDYQLFIDKL